jgi:hypothetical protein
MLSACASVLAQMNSTPCTPQSIADRVAAATADADHLDEGCLVGILQFHHFDAHGEPC